MGDGPAYEPPATAERASCKVIFDGVLYNRAELANRFADSSDPAAVSDADLILRAYLHWGEDMLHNIKGIFALFIWDGRRDLLLCARDPLGVYPLFYTDTGHKMLFSSSIEALVQHPDVSDAVSRTALADYLAHRPHIPEETFFDAVKRLLPGHAMRVKGKSRHDYRYWNPVPDVTEVDWVSEDELGRFDELLDQAVNRCLQFGQAGIFLSGGLDSVSVAAVATDNSRRRGLPDPLALSLIFPSPEVNEEVIQRRVASDLGLPHKLVPFGEAAGSAGLLASAMRMSSEWPVPLTNPWAPAYETLLLEGKRQGCRAILTGGGGDEWLTIGPDYAADLLRGGDVGGLYRLWKSVRQTFGHSRLRTTRIILWTCGARPWLGFAGRTVLRRTAQEALRWRWQRRISQSTPDWVAPDPTLRREINQRAVDSQLKKPERHQSFYYGQWDLDHPLVSMSMETDFESWRRTGVRELMPYWDADLVDFLYRTPPEFLIRGERSKALVRQTVARRFPGLNFERQKKVVGFNFFTNLMLEEGPHLWREMEGAPALAELGIVDATVVDSAVSELLSGTQPWYEAQRIRDIALLEGWLRPRLGMPLPPAVVEAGSNR